MFRCELEFDEKKIVENGYTLEEVYQDVDRIFEKLKVPKITEGVYEDVNTDDSNLTMMATFMLLDCPVVVHFCSKWRMIDPEEGDQGECEKNLDLFKTKRHLMKSNFNSCGGEL